MPHPRRAIREAVKAALLGQTPAGSRVFETRSVPWRNQELPAISVYSADEEVDPASRNTAPRELKRTLNLHIEAAVALFADGNVDDALDDLALEVERVMEANETLGGVASDSILVSSELGTMNEGNRPMGAIRMVYAITYYTSAPRPENVTLDDLRTADVRYNQRGLQPEADEVRDTLAAPAAPTSLVATPIGTPVPQVGLAWAHTGVTETGFRIDRCSGAACTGFAEHARVGKSVLAFTDAEVVNGTTYRYRVVALAGEFASAASNIQEVTVP